MKSSKNLALFLMLTCTQGYALDLTYNGGVAGVWTNGGGGWLDGGSPVSWNNAAPDAAVFTGTAPTGVTIDGGGVTVGNITVSSGSYSFTGPGALTLSSTTWSVAAGLTNTVSAGLAGTTGLTKTGDGLLSLSETNKTFTGGTVINGGAILIANAVAGSLGASNSASLTLNGGALHTQFSANATVNYAITVGAGGGEIRNIGLDATNGRLTLASNRLNGSGVLTVSFGTNQTRVILGGTNTATQTNFTGKWLVDGGSNVRFVDLYAGINFGNVTGDDAVTLRTGANLLLRAGTYQTNSGGGTFGLTLGSGGGRLNIGGSSTVVLATKVSGAVSNTLTLGVENGSILVLSNTANSYLGDTAIIANSGGSNGVVRLGASEVIPDATNSGTVSVGANTTFDVNGFSEAIGALAGAGVVDNRAVSNAATITVGANNQSTSFTGQISNSGTGASLALVKTGSGTLFLSNSASAFSGGSTLRGGRLVAGHANALGSGNILLQASGTNRATLVLSNLTMTGKTLTMDSTTNRAILLSGSLAGATWDGGIVLAGSAGTNGSTELANDTGNGALTVAGSITGSITGGSLNLRGTSVTNTLSAAVSIGTTPLNKIDTGAWVMAASGNSMGTVTVGGGRLEVQGLTLVDGDVRSETANPATLAFGVSSGVTYGRFNQTGAATLTNTNTTVAVRFLGGYEPTNNETYQIFAGAVSGSPALSLPTLTATNLAWVTNTFLSSGQLSVTNTAPSSAYSQWLTNYPGLTGTNTNGLADPERDGFVNNLEFAFDGDPTKGSPALLQATKSGTNGVFSFVGRLAGTAYAVLSTTNLTTGPWTTNATATATIATSTNQSGVLLPGQYERKQFTAPLNTREFFRVEAVTAD
jgi:autotransporter-associated beta strand protein